MVGGREPRRARASSTPTCGSRRRTGAREPASPPRGSDHTLPAGAARSQYETGAGRPLPIVDGDGGRRSRSSHGPLPLRGGRLGRSERRTGDPADRPRTVATAEPGSAGWRVARTSFLVDDAGRADVVRDPILASWTRSRLLARADRPPRACPFESDLDGESALPARPPDRCSRDVADQFGERAVSVILSDADGVVLTPRHRRLARCEPAWTRSGWPPASATPRSTSARTASAPRWRAAGRRGCSATSTTSSTSTSWPAPACRSGTRSRGKLLGVVDLTCWRRDAGTIHGRRGDRHCAGGSRRCCWSSPGGASWPCCTTT